MGSTSRGRYSFFVALFITLSLLHVAPTDRFLAAKSYNATQTELRARSCWQLGCLACALLFGVLWVGLSERLQSLLRQASIISAARLATFDSPSAPPWVLLCMLLDFLGRAVLAKVFFCDVLLLFVTATELDDPTAMQRVMRQDVQSLFGMAGADAPRDTPDAPSTSMHEARAPPKATAAEQAETPSSCLAAQPVATADGGTARTAEVGCQCDIPGGGKRAGRERIYGALARRKHRDPKKEHPNSQRERAPPQLAAASDDHAAFQA